MRDLLVTFDPWGNQPRCRADCKTCTSNGYGGKACKTRSIVYETVCLDSKKIDKLKSYIGETYITSNEQMKKHISDAKNPKVLSHISEDKNSVHPNRPDNNGMFAITV